MSFGGDSATYEIIVDLSQVSQLGDVMASSAAKGAAGVKKSISGLDNAVAAASRGVTTQAQKLGANIAKGTAQGIKSNSALVQQALIQAQTQGVRGQQQAAAAAARANLAAQNAGARLQIAQAQAAGKAQAIAAQTSGQLAIAAARTSGAQRVAITRFTLDTIGRLEKGLGRVIEGTASTIVSATRRVFAGTVGSIQRSFAERRSVITRNLNIENGLFAQSAAVQQRASRGLLGAGLGAAGLLGGGALAIGALRQTFTLGSDFARGLNVLQAQLQLTDAQMASVSDQAIQLGNDIALPGVSALDAANAINLLSKQFASLGPAALQAAQDAAKGTLQLARAVGAPAEEAAQAVGAAVNVFKAPAAEAVKIADQLAAGLSQAAGTSFSDFNLAFTQGAAVVSNFLVPAEGATGAITEFTSAIAVLARGGVIGSDAGTSLKQFFLQANRGTEDANTALAEISQRAGVAGTAFFDESGKARHLFDTISILRRGLEGLTDEQKQSTIQTLFGADAARSASILIGQGEAEFLKTTAAVLRQGAAADLAAAQNKGLAGAIDAIKSQFETFGILIFQKVNPFLGKAGLAIAGFIDKLANAGGVFAAVRAGLKGVAAALGTLVAIKGLGEILGFGRALLGLLGPLGITAVILGGAIGFLAKRFGSFGELLAATGRLIARISPQVAALRKVIFDFLSNLAGRATVLGRFSGFLQQIFNLLGQGKAAQAFDRLKVAAGALLQNLKPIGDAFKLLIIPLRNFLQGNFVEAFSGLKHVGVEIATALATAINAGLKAVNPFVGVGLDFIAKFKAQFIGAGIGAVAGGLLGGPLGVVIGAGIGVAVTNGILKLKESIGRIDVGSLFGKFLDGVRVVGQKLAQLLFDKKTLLAVAGVAAAAAAIAAQFVVGFAQGLISKLGDIRAAGAQIIKAIFDLPSVVKSIAALAILIRGTLTGQFKSAGIGKAIGSVLGKEIADSTAQAVDKGTLGSRLKASFVAIGKGAGQALSIGVAAALSGSAIGSANGGLDQAIGLASLAGSVAAAGAAFGPVGAAGAAGIGLVTTAMSQNAKNAQEATDRMVGFRDAILQTGDVAKGTAKNIDAIFGPGGSFPTALKGVLSQTSFTTEGFAKAISAGKGGSFIADIQKQVLELTHSVPTAISVAGLLKQQLKGVADAAKEIDLAKKLKSGGDAARGAVGFVGALLTKVLETSAAQKRLGEKIATERAKASVEVLKSGMDDLKTAATDARQAVIDALNPPTAKTPKQGADLAVTNLPGAASDVGAAVEQGITSVLGGAQLATALDTFKEQLKTAISDGAGNIFDATTVAANLDTVRTAIGELQVGDEIKSQLLGAVSQFQSEVLPVVVPLDAQADLIAAAAAGDQVAAEALAALGRTGPISIKSKADAVAAGLAGEGIFTTADTFVRRHEALVKSKADTASAQAAGQTIVSIVGKVVSAFTAKPKVSADSAGAEAVGRNIVTSMGRGIAGATAFVTKAITTVTNGVTQSANAVFRISSPSKVFMDIGEQVMAGLEEGIKSGGGAVMGAVESVAQAMIDATRNVANSLPSALSTLFGNSFTRGAIGGGGKTGGTVAAFNEAVHDVFFQVASNFDTLWQAASKEAGQRSLEENMLLFFGEKNNSLDAGTVFGRANRTAIVGAVDAIKAIGDALLEQGFSAQSAADMLAKYRAQLLTTATQAGLSAVEVNALVDSLGLSGANLADFVNQANRLNQIVAEGQRRAVTPSTPPPLTAGPNPTQQFITNNLYLPTGDPEANALAVVNRLALAVR